MWQVVFIAHSKKRAENMKDRLTQEGFLVKLQAMGSSDRDGYQLLVPAGEAEEVAEFLGEAYTY